MKRYRQWLLLAAIRILIAYLFEISYQLSVISEPALQEGFPTEATGVSASARNHALAVRRAVGIRAASP
ncbi:hypothetical protein DP116_25510 [Brasilonema bromeliae SPC951]|uniref:Uncharacterized protein n=1 Tax=Brasilonema bromeliae SPC951 TaxID=385972 RepID=A0ABX1PDT5_9CYAN|nr:hypothetical protein [Brasilonema bromeliae SPC951]